MKEIDDIIRNNHWEIIRFYNFICYDFPEIDNKIVKLNKFNVLFLILNIEQLLQISILYYQFYLYSYYKKTNILIFEIKNNNLPN